MHCLIDIAALAGTKMLWGFCVESVNENIYFLKRDCKIEFNEQIRKIYYLAQLRHVLFVT